MTNVERYGPEIMSMYTHFQRLAFPERFQLARRKWRQNNPERAKELDKKYWSNSRDRYREHSRQWSKDNKDKVNASSRKRYAENPNHRIRVKLRNYLNVSMRRHRAKKSDRTMSLLGCSIEDFKIYIESLFEEGMSWENYGKGGWELDHIMPCAIFDLTDPGHQKRCFHFSNLQPMWAKENRRKGKILSGFLKK